MASIKGQPLSIESLLQKQKEEKEAAAKVRLPIRVTSDKWTSRLSLITMVSMPFIAQVFD